MQLKGAYVLSNGNLFFQMKHCCVEDPSDLCSVNVSGQDLVDIKEEDLALFDNVAYVNASDNLLPIGM